MIGYLFILITVVLNVSKGGFSKKVSAHLDCTADNINICLVRNLFCVLFSAMILFATNTSFFVSPSGFAISAFSGISTTVNYIFWLMALKGDAYMLASTMSNSSFIIAAICGIVIFHETPSVMKMIAFVLIVIAVFFMTRYQTKLYKKPNFKDFVLLFLVFLTAGTNSVSQKLFTTYASEFPVSVFTFYTFVVSCLLLFVLRPFFKANKSFKGQTKKVASLLPFVLFMGLALYGATFFQTEATKLVDAVILYPLSSALSILGSSVMAWVWFSEKPSKDSIVGAFFVICAMVLSRF